MENKVLAGSSANKQSSKYTILSSNPSKNQHHKKSNETNQSNMIANLNIDNQFNDNIEDLLESRRS